MKFVVNTNLKCNFLSKLNSKDDYVVTDSLQALEHYPYTRLIGTHHGTAGSQLNMC
jgi:hypothetical protein